MGNAWQGKINVAQNYRGRTITSRRGICDFKAPRNQSVNGIDRKSAYGLVIAQQGAVKIGNKQLLSDIRKWHSGHAI